MRRFRCACGAGLFFENDVCLVCRRTLGFDAGTLDLLALAPDGAGFRAEGGGPVRLCENRIRHAACNWLVPAGSEESLCSSCRLTEIIPSLDRPGNLGLWRKVEAAKRRLIYTLLSLGMPLEAGPGHGLRFRILEDRRRNPDVDEDFVVTGHLEGLVTVNLAEADDVARTEAQLELRERYRTVLGHLRHEAGHFYFGHLTERADDLLEVRALFGDERSPYGPALRRYYAEGPDPDWSERYLGPYASAHPHEDFAETFAHYLHIIDALETAGAGGLGPIDGERPPTDWIGRWMDLSITLNELNRSLGTEDPYPFVLTRPVIDKLSLMDRLVRRRA